MSLTSGGPDHRVDVSLRDDGPGVSLVPWPHLYDVLMPLPTQPDPACLPFVGHHARLTPLYANDFAAPFTQGRSQGPRGEGSHTADADSMVPFHYRVVVESGRDGQRTVRFPTMREQPGGGNFYSWFAAYVACRHGLAEGDRLYAWTVHLPQTLRLHERCAYYENRHVFALGVEDMENHLGLRFEHEHSLVWVRGLNEREELLGHVTLRRGLVPGEALRFSAAVRWGSDAVAVSIDGGDGPLAVGIAPTISLSRTSVAVLSSSGNTVPDNHDASEFCRLSQVRVHAVESGRDGPAILDDALLLPPGLRWR